jgi:uncharacterized protein
MSEPETPEIPEMSRSQVLVVIAITAIVLLVVTKAWMFLGQVSLLPSRWSLQSLGWGIGGALMISLASEAIYRLWPAYRESANFYVQMVVKPLAWPDLLWLGLLPGLSEELLFRGVMLPAFGQNWEGILISSCCFGALHLSGWRQWPYVFWATIVGAGLGWSAIWSGNLLVPIVAHSLTNIISGCVWKYRNSSRPDRA